MMSTCTIVVQFRSRRPGRRELLVSVSPFTEQDSIGNGRLTLSTESPYLRARDVDSVLVTNHKSNLTGITVESGPSILFSGNGSCILSPEVTQGPYWVQGELVREDITDNQEGVPLTLDIQIIDVNTCEPVPQAFLEIWHCNSTGVYSGVVANGNGNTNDTANLDNTFLRGIQQSNEDGVVTFETTFPGHYTGRAVSVPLYFRFAILLTMPQTHIHIMTSQNATINANETLSGGSVTHVGQLFFDQDLITLIEAEEPYASNTQDITTNANDSILNEEADTVDPFMEYVLLSDNVADGVFGWLAFGMNTGASYNTIPAAYLTENGGVENENSGGGMGGGMGGSLPGGSGAPSGVRPSGADAMPSISGASSSASGVSSSTSAALISASVMASTSGASQPTNKATPSPRASAALHNSPQHGDRKSSQNGPANQHQQQRPQAAQTKQLTHDQLQNGPRA
jgi:protocatechuate 3,4-dioxygenase beta subunit